MNEYIQIEFQNIVSEKSDLLIAELDLLGFDGFEETETNLRAFIKSSNFKESTLKEIAYKLEVSYKKTVIEETNWNAVWESNFQAVMVDDFAGIRADFHEPLVNLEHEIIITPKMSFGTGHHATTYMMIQQMREIDFNRKSVFDFGTGTGVLAILAEKMGASSIVAIDNDDWSIENATENFNRNACNRIEIFKTNTADLNKSFDIILANINKNVILLNLSILIKQLNTNGILLLSGLLSEDESDIIETVGKNNAFLVKKMERTNWISLRINH